MQIEMFGESKPPLKFILGGHFGQRLDRPIQAIQEQLKSSWRDRLICASIESSLRRCAAHGQDHCVNVDCLTSCMTSIDVGRCCLCGQDVVIVRKGSVFVAPTCPGRPPRTAPRIPGVGVVYFIHDPGNNAVKIGHTSSDPKKRLEKLQVGQPTRLVLLVSVPGDYQTEGEMHQRFAAQHLRGEWFKLAGGLKTFLRRQGVSGL